VIIKTRVFPAWQWGYPIKRVVYLVKEGKESHPRGLKPLPKSIHLPFSLSIKYSLYVFIISSSVLYTTSRYDCHFSTRHRLSIYLTGDHLEGQIFNLKWPNRNEKLSKLPLTHFVLYQCKTTLVSSD